MLGSHRQRLWGQGSSVALSGDGAWAVAGGFTVDSLLIDVTTAATSVLPQCDDVRSFAMSPAGQMIYRLRGDQLSLLFKKGEEWVVTPLPMREALADVMRPSDAHFSANGVWLTASVLHELVENVARFSTFVWDVSTEPPKIVIDLKGYKHPSLSADGQRLAVIDMQDGSLHIFDVNSLPAKPLLKLPGVTIDCSSYRSSLKHGFLGDGTLGVLDTAARLSVWDVSATEPKLIAEPDVSRKASPHFDPSHNGGLRPFRTGEPRFVLHNENGFQSWRVEKGAIAPEFSMPTSTTGWWGDSNLGAVAISLDGRTMASLHLNRMVKLYEVTGEGFRERHPIR